MNMVENSYLKRIGEKSVVQGVRGCLTDALIRKQLRPEGTFVREGFSGSMIDPMICGII